MSTQTFHYDSRHGDIVHQTYSLPWPLKPRELLMRCSNEISRSEQTVSAKCNSVHTEKVPITPKAVRMEVLESTWKFESLEHDRTHITVELAISEKFAVGVPSFIIDYVQKHSLKESVKNFASAAKRLRLPADKNFVGWRREREPRGRSASSWRRAAAATTPKASAATTSAAPRASPYTAGALAAVLLGSLLPVIAIVLLGGVLRALEEIERYRERRSQTRAWRRWKRFETRRLGRDGSARRSRRQVSAPVLALSEQYAVLAATKPKGGGGGLARSWSELCLADSGSEKGMSQRSYSATSDRLLSGSW